MDCVLLVFVCIVACRLLLVGWCLLFVGVIRCLLRVDRMLLCVCCVRGVDCRVLVFFLRVDCCA